MSPFKYVSIALLALMAATCVVVSATVMDDVPRPVRIRVKNTLEQPISNASVQLFVNGGSTPIGTGVTDSQGEYLFSAVMPGNYYVNVAASGYQSDQEYFSVSTQDVTVDVTLTQ